jgi:hypothetical protein
VSRNGPNLKTRICFQGKNIHLGTFVTPQEASEVYQEARQQIDGSFVPPNGRRVAFSDDDGEEEEVSINIVCPKWL